VVNSRPSKGSVPAASGQVALRFMAVVDAVWMVSVELADELPGVIAAGENRAVAPVGWPLAASVTALEKLPFCAVAVMVNCAEPPG
jgi:hypothetical protein